MLVRWYQMAPSLEQDLIELYGVAPDEFVRARNALVGRLRKAGRSGDAVEIAGLRKPSIPLWVVNHVARLEPDAVRQLVEAVDRLKRAHFGGPAEVATATEDQRAALHRLVDRARQALHGAGLKPSPAVLDRVTGTLLGAAADVQARADLRHGRLQDERQAPGFEALTGQSGGRRPRAQQQTESVDHPPPKVRPARSNLRAARAEHRQLTRKAQALDRTAAQRARAADQGARAADQLRAKLRELEQRAQRAREEADRASQAAREAQEKADRAGEKLR